MKSVKITALILSAVALSACAKGEKDTTELDAQLNQAAQVGQAQAIAEIIERASAEPCQPINLFNNIDEANKKEVNLINIACESLDLPEIPVQAAAEPTPEEPPTE